MSAARRRCSPVADRLQELLDRCEALLPSQEKSLASVVDRAPSAAGQTWKTCASGPPDDSSEFLGNYQSVPLDRRALVAVLSGGAAQGSQVEPAQPPRAEPPAPPQGQAQLQLPPAPAPAAQAAGVERQVEPAQPPPPAPPNGTQPQLPPAPAPATQTVLRYVLDPSTGRYVVQQSPSGPPSPLGGSARAAAGPTTRAEARSAGGHLYVYDPSTGAYRMSAAGGAAGALVQPPSTSRRGTPSQYVQLPAAGQPQIAPPQYAQQPVPQLVPRTPSIHSVGSYSAVAAPATGAVLIPSGAAPAAAAAPLLAVPVRELPGTVTPGQLASTPLSPGLSPGGRAAAAPARAPAAPAAAPAAPAAAPAAPAAAPATPAADRRPPPPQPAPPPRQAPAALPAAAAPAAAPRPRTVLSPTVQLFSQAVVGAGPGGATGLLRVPLLDGLDALSVALDKLKSGMGEHLQANVRKLRASKADASESSYGPWLLSEAPVHKATKFRGYVDDSAWMANLWAYRTLEFFVELFGLVAQGRNTRAAIDAAYQQTLCKHHNMIQRMGFQAGVSALPSREEFIQRLAGAGAGAEDVQRDFESFVASGRSIVAFCAGMNKQCEARLAVERKKYEGR